LGMGMHAAIGAGGTAALKGAKGLAARWRSRSQGQAPWEQVGAAAGDARGVHSEPQRGYNPVPGATNSGGSGEGGGGGRGATAAEGGAARGGAAPGGGDGGASVGGGGGGGAQGGSAADGPAGVAPILEELGAAREPTPAQSPEGSSRAR